MRLTILRQSFVVKNFTNMQQQAFDTKILWVL